MCGGTGWLRDSGGTDPPGGPKPPPAQQHPSGLPRACPAPRCLHQQAGAAGVEGGPGSLGPGAGGPSAWPGGSASIEHFPLSRDLLHSCGPGDGGATGNAPTKGSPRAASPAGDVPRASQSPLPPHAPAALPGRALRPSHCPVPADDFPLTQLRRRHVPHQVDKELPALLRDVGVGLLCRGKALSAGSVPLPEPVPARGCCQVTPGTWTRAQAGREDMGTVGGQTSQQPWGDAQEHGGRAGCCPHCGQHRQGSVAQASYFGDGQRARGQGKGGVTLQQSQPRPGHRWPCGAARPSLSPGTHPQAGLSS